jgi:hypothetical protein
MNRDIMGAGMRVTLMLNTMDFLLPRPNWLWPTLTPNTTPFQG